jgi:hypothetical protein
MLAAPHDRVGVRVFGLALVTALAGACNLLNGSADLATGDGPGGGVLGDGGSGGDGGGSGRDGSAGNTDGGGESTDGGPDFVPDSGIDPQLTSCGTNLICLPDVAGWTPAVYVPVAGQKNACPTTYPQANTLQTSGGGSCACACSAKNGSCAGSVTTKSGAACGGAPTDLGVASDQCTPLAAVLTLPVSFTANPNGTPPTACGATVTSKLNPPHAGTYCTGAVPSAGMCAAGEACVPKPSVFNGGFACIVHDGDIACPPKLLFRMQYGTTVTDGRSCGTTCSCAPQPCAGTIEAFSDGACATSVRSVAVDGTCITAGAPMTGSSYKYTPSLGCGVSTPAPVLGSETYTGTKTLCCGIGF